MVETNMVKQEYNFKAELRKTIAKKRGKYTAKDIFLLMVDTFPKGRGKDVSDIANALRDFARQGHIIRVDGGFKNGG